MSTRGNRSREARGQSASGGTCRLPVESRPSVERLGTDKLLRLELAAGLRGYRSPRIRFSIKAPPWVAICLCESLNCRPVRCIVIFVSRLKGIWVSVPISISILSRHSLCHALLTIVWTTFTRMIFVLMNRDRFRLGVGTVSDP